MSGRDAKTRRLKEDAFLILSLLSSFQHGITRCINCSFCLGNGGAIIRTLNEKEKLTYLDANALSLSPPPPSPPPPPAPPPPPLLLSSSPCVWLMGPFRRPQSLMARHHCLEASLLSEGVTGCSKRRGVQSRLSCYFGFPKNNQFT